MPQGVLGATQAMDAVLARVWPRADALACGRCLVLQPDVGLALVRDLVAQLARNVGPDVDQDVALLPGLGGVFGEDDACGSPDHPVVAGEAGKPQGRPRHTATLPGSESGGILTY